MKTWIKVLAWGPVALAIIIMIANGSLERATLTECLIYGLVVGVFVGGVQIILGDLD